MYTTVRRVYMTTEVMTVHKGLAELKILSDRINKAISEGVFCTAAKHSAAKLNGVSRDEYVKVIQGSYDTAEALLKRQKAIKRSIDLSNAVTSVEVCGITYTVAEAIWMKNSGTYYDQMLLHALQQQYAAATAKINNENGDALESRADSYAEVVYGDKDSKASSSDIIKVREDFIKSNSYELIDPIKILDKINELEKRISEFTAEIDAALSVSNALTSITVSY